MPCANNRSIIPGAVEDIPVIIDYLSKQCSVAQYKQDKQSNKADFNVGYILLIYFFLPSTRVLILSPPQKNRGAHFYTATTFYPDTKLLRGYQISTRARISTQVLIRPPFPEKNRGDPFYTATTFYPVLDYYPGTKLVPGH